MDRVSDLINWMYRDLAHLEGERENQAIRTMHLTLYVISAALQTQKGDESMRYLLRAFWNEFQPTLEESVYDELTSTKLGKASKVTHEMRSGQVCYTFVWQIRDGDYLYPVFVVTTENEEVLTEEQRNLDYWSGMALKGTICLQYTIVYAAMGHFLVHFLGYSLRENAADLLRFI